MTGKKMSILMIKERWEAGINAMKDWKQSI